MGGAVAAWIATAVVTGILQRMRATRSGLLAQPRSWLGMHVAHLGIAVFVAGVTLVTSYETEQDLRMVPGSTATSGGYELTFQGVNKALGPNYKADVGDILLSKWTSLAVPPSRKTHLLFIGYGDDGKPDLCHRVNK